MSAADWPVEVHPTWGCWEWSGRLDEAGYPIVWRGKSPVKAYRIVHEKERGPIPEGLVFDHECRNRRCVRPSHGALVTQSENLFRRNWRYRARMTKCQNGHSLSTAIVTPWGGRLCRTCQRDDAAPSSSSGPEAA